jgi:hypothetical protein
MMVLSHRSVMEARLAFVCEAAAAVDVASSDIHINQMMSEFGITVIPEVVTAVGVDVVPWLVGEPTTMLPSGVTTP